MRILIAGGPRTGKTTLAGKLAEQLNVVPLHTDDLIGRMAWSAASDEARLWMEQSGPWCIEGVAVVRALRKWLAVHADGKPADVLYLGDAARDALSRGQLAMAKGHTAIWAEIKDELRRRGLEPVAF